MNGNLQFDIGDICEDPTGLRVRVEDVDMYNYVHFSVVNNRDRDNAPVGEMSQVAFDHRFVRIANGGNRNAA
jgi:hypothetical protein